MPIAIAIRRHSPLGWACIIFGLLSVLDGFWKTSLLRGAHIDFWAYDFAKWLIVPALLIAFVHRASAFQPRDYGLSAALGAKDILYILPLPLITLFMVDIFVMAMANRALGYPQATFDHTIALASLGSLWAAGTIYFSVTAGLWESIFFIGLPWLWFSRGAPTSAWLAPAFVLLTALFFAAAHWENGLPNAIGAFFFQLIAFYWYRKLGTLLPVIGAHILMDVYFFWPRATP